MKTFRVIYKDSSVQTVTAESINSIQEPIKWGSVGSVEEVKEVDFAIAIHPIINSEYKLLRMNSGKLMLQHSEKMPVDISTHTVLGPVEGHISYLECHIHELQEKIKKLEQQLHDQVKNPPKSLAIAQLRELCGQVENATDSHVTIFQDDATKNWHIKVGHTIHSKMYWGETLLIAIQTAYEKHFA